MRNLNNSGPGSLRQVVASATDKYITFAVSGNIELLSPLTIDIGGTTIDGASAPNGGICLKNFGIILDAPNCTLKHFRIRPGAGSGQAVDSLYLTELADNALIEHCSLSWSVDENLQILAHGVEIRYCIISEALNNSVHPDGGHSKNAWWCFGANRVNFHHNLIAHGGDRNPTITCGDCEVVNNVLYNVNLPTIIAPIESAVRCNYIGNIMVDGVNTWEGYNPAYRPMLRWSNNYPPIESSAVYVENNICGDRPTNDLAENLCIDQDELAYVVEEKILVGFGITPVDVFAAYTDVLANAGASPRDAVDARIVADVENQTGSIIDDPSEVGGWPDLTL